MLTTVMQPGEIVRERYRIEGSIGQGGMGIVHRATDLQSGATVAIKVLTLPPGESLLRFKREFRVMARLDHPRVVRVIESGSHGDAAYVVMAYLSGGTLSEHYAGGARDPHDLAARLDLLAEIADALAYVHAQGIVHRDIKPENVLLEGGAPHLMDFGLAKSDGQATVALTQAGAVLGTVAYMSPEQARGHALDTRSDLYALGCLLHWLVTGTPPFEGASLIEVLVKHLREPAPAPSQRIPFAPLSLDALAQSLLQKVPGDRPSSAAEVVAALRGVASELRGGSATPDTPAEATPGALLRPPLIGRDDLWGHLVSRLDSRPPRATLLESATGLGATRLLEELAQEARARRRLVVWVRHPPGSRNLPYDGWRRALARLLENDPAAFTRAASGHEAPLSWLLPDLAGDATAVALPADVAQLRLVDAIDTVLGRIAAEHPHGVLLAIDDLHHADEGSVALGAYVSRGAGATSLTMVASIDPVAGSAAKQALRAFDGDRLTLAPLERSAARDLIAALLGGQVEDRLADHVAGRAGGNPSFIHGLVEALLQAGQIRRSAGQWSWERSEVQLPPGIEEVFVARIDALAPRARTTIGAASAIGEEVDFDLLQTLTALDEGDLLDDLDELLRGHFLTDVGGGDRYRFTHPLLRETLHGRLAARRRRRYHQILADLFAARPDAPPEALAEHHAETDTPERAVPFALEAARRAESVYANDVAERYYRLALGVLPADDPTRSAIAVALGGVLGRIGRWEEATAVLERASVGATRAEALRALGQLAYRRGDLDASERHLREALTAGATSAEAHRLLGEVLFGRGDHAGAEAALTTALACAQASGGVPGDLARVQIDLGRLAYGRGRLDDAMQAYRAAEASAAQAGDPLLDARVRQVVGIAHYSAGRLDEAIADFERAQAAFQKAGDVAGAMASEYYLGMAYEELGEAGRAAALFERVRALTHRYGDEVNGAKVAATWGWLLMRLGRYDEALEQLRHACAFFTAQGFVPIAQRARLNAAVVLARLERFEEARAEVAAVAEELRGETTPYQGALLALTEGEVALRGGDAAEAAPLLEQAHGSFVALGNPQEATEAALLAAEAHLALGDAAGTEANLAAADATAADLADPSWGRQIAFLRALRRGDVTEMEAIEVAAEESGLLACLEVARRTQRRHHLLAHGRRGRPEEAP